MTDSILRSYFSQSHSTFVPFHLIEPGFLEDFPGATAGYSLRKLSGSATAAVRIRRSSDNAEQDFGFSGDDFDAASAASFIGGGSGFVTTWYDQSGNSRHMTQTTAANQPAYLASGIDSKPCLDFDGSDDYMDAVGTTLDTFVNATAGYNINVVKMDDFGPGTSDAGWLWSDGAAGNADFLVQDLGPGTPRISAQMYDTGQKNAIVSPLATATDYIWEWQLNGGNIIGCVNGGSDTTTATVGNITSMSAGPMRIGRFFSGTDFQDGKVAEMIWWDAGDPGRTSIKAAVNAYYTIY